MNVGSITVINLTGNNMDIMVNSNSRKHTIGKMETGTIEFENNDDSPVDKEGAGYTPKTMVFLRAIDADQNYFGNQENVVDIEVGGISRSFKFTITGKGEQALTNSATLTITRESFVLAAPNGTVWLLLKNEDNNNDNLTESSSA